MDKIKRAIVFRDGRVAEILSPEFVASNTDWVENGLPETAAYIDDDEDVLIGDEVTADGKVDRLPRRKAEKKAELAKIRYNAEVGGVIMAGMNILTDRESQSMITGAALAATLDPSYTCRWKTPQGFVTLDAKTIIGAASAVRAHVQSCFDKEAELCAAVEAAKTPEEVAAISWI